MADRLPARQGARQGRLLAVRACSVRLRRRVFLRLCDPAGGHWRVVAVWRGTGDDDHRGLDAGERLGVRESGGLLVALAGLVALFFPGLSAPPIGGSSLMVVAGIAWGMYSLRGRGHTDATEASADNFLRTVPLAALLSLVTWSEVQLDGPGIAYAVLSGALTSGVGYAIWYAALRGLTATRAATVQLTVPVFAAVGGGVLFLGEPVTPRLALAAMAILGGVALVIQGRVRS